MDWWVSAAKDVIPYLNITARWDGAPEQDLLQKKGGRGFPYCTLMDEKGEVVWEVRPTSQEVWEENLGHYHKLQSLRAALKERPDDKVLAASAGLLDAIGRQQRQRPPFEDLDTMAEAEGVDPDIVAQYKKLRRNETIMGAIRSAREDEGAAAYKLFKEGVVPDEDRSALLFFRVACLGAVAAKDGPAAKECLARFEKLGQANKDFEAYMSRNLPDLRKRVENL